LSEKQINIFFLGTAGSGKTALTQAFNEWLKERGLDVIVVNLDPGVELTPYSPDIDVRDWVNVGDVMEKYGVGPNGAQIISADLMAVNFREITDLLEEYKTQFVLFDTPGQIELFAYRQATKVVLESLGESNSLFFFLFDPVLSSTPNGFVSLLILSVSIQFRFRVPFLNLISKSDLLDDEQLNSVLQWGSDFNSLYDALTSENIEKENQAKFEFFKALESLGSMGNLFPVSAKTYIGMEDVYNSIQQAYFSGEDALPD
jgi:GTPase SAR1 family protein